MRDTRKNNEYFNSYLKCQHSRIETKIQKMENADSEKKQRILASVSSFEIDLLKAKFSSGSDFSEMKNSIINAMNIMCEYANMSYDQLLNILSLAVIFGVNQEAIYFIEKNNKKIKKDRLLSFLASGLASEKVFWDTNLELQKDYLGLDEVFISNKKEDAVIKYLESWYYNHSDYSWFDSHLTNTNTYCGYWSFESAAIAKIMEIDESKLSVSIYYPYL